MDQAIRPAGTSLPASQAIADRYLAEAGGDAVLALHRAVSDAMADLCEAERRTLARDRLISQGYVRAGLMPVCAPGAPPRGKAGYDDAPT